MSMSACTRLIRSILQQLAWRSGVVVVRGSRSCFGKKTVPDEVDFCLRKLFLFEEVDFYK